VEFITERLDPDDPDLLRVAAAVAQLRSLTE
jgi:hypothetical protein